MHPNDSVVRALPDVANEMGPVVAGRLDWVGMSGIDAPVTLVREDGQAMQLPARVSACVNLSQPDVRGIHMSRLYLHVDRALSAEPLTPCAIRRLLREFLDSHAELSDRATVGIAFDYLVRRPALKSDNSGWKSYPVTVTGALEQGHFTLELACEVVYSSTCPCSAALARQLIQQRFAHDFDGSEPLDYGRVLDWLGSEQGIRATPHSQRSTATVRVKLAPSFGFPIVDLVDLIEGALGTPVQTAVKREDEQAFALLNGQNLMFCEDAARRIQAALDRDQRIVDFHVRATHQESLHPHDAVAVVTKGIDGGYAPGV